MSNLTFYDKNSLRNIEQWTMVWLRANCQHSARLGKIAYHLRISISSVLISCYVLLIMALCPKMPERIFAICLKSTAFQAANDFWHSNPLHYALRMGIAFLSNLDMIIAWPIYRREVSQKGYWTSVYQEFWGKIKKHHDCSQKIIPCFLFTDHCHQKEILPSGHQLLVLAFQK